MNLSHEQAPDIHDFWEIVYVDRGQFKILLDGDEKTINEGECMIYSQIVGTQAVNNVLFAEDGRYSRVTKEFKGLVRGEYGKCPAPISDEFKQKIIGDDTIIDYRPADKIAPEMDTLRQKVAPYSEQEEDLLSLALFEQVAVKFFDWRKQQKYKLDENAD